MGLSASGSPPTSRWLPAWRSKLGVMTNPEIAKVAGVSRWTVWMKARAMGYNGAPPRIVATAPLNWFPEHGHLLGVLPDAEIAKRAGVSTFTVSVARRKRGIRSSRRAWAPAPELAPLLGLLPDGEVARRAGVSRFMVIAARRNVGIPAAPHGCYGDGLGGGRRGRLVWGRAWCGGGLAQWPAGAGLHWPLSGCDRRLAATPFIWHA